MPLYLFLMGQKLQLVQNSAVSLVSGTFLYCHITPILALLHWLLLCYQAKFKVFMLTF